MSKETGGPAFPVPIAGDTAGFVDAEECGVATGITIRDYMAAKVLPAIYKEHWEEVVNNGATFADDWPTGLAMDAYRLADAMLAVRAISKATGE